MAAQEGQGPVFLLGWYFQSPEQPLEGAGVGLKGRRGGEAQVLAQGHVVSE